MRPCSKRFPLAIPSRLVGRRRPSLYSAPATDAFRAPRCADRAPRHRAGGPRRCRRRPVPGRARRSCARAHSCGQKGSVVERASAKALPCSMIPTMIGSRGDVDLAPGDGVGGHWLNKPSERPRMIPTAVREPLRKVASMRASRSSLCSSSFMLVGVPNRRRSLALQQGTRRACWIVLAPERSWRACEVDQTRRCRASAATDAHAVAFVGRQAAGAARLARGWALCRLKCPDPWQRPLAPE